MPNLSKESRILQPDDTALGDGWCNKKDKVSQVPETMRSIDVGDGAQTMVNGSHWRDNRFITISSRKITIASNYPSITKNRSYLDVSFLFCSGFRCSSVHSRDTKMKLYIQVQQLVTLLSFDLLGVFSWERQWTVLKKMVRIYWKNICVNHTYD